MDRPKNILQQITGLENDRVNPGPNKFYSTDDNGVKGWFEDGGLLTVEVTVSAAELQTIQATPKELIAAPGVGKAIFVTDGYIIQKSVTTDYSSGGLFALTQGNKSLFNIGTLRQGPSFPKSFLQRLGGMLSGTGFIEDTWENKALTLTNSFALGDGDGYLFIYLRYKILNFPI